MIRNISSSTKSICHFVSCKFTPCKEDIPTLVREMSVPQDR